MIRRYKNLIIGGGFSGLYLLSKLDDALLIERAERLGGLLTGFTAGRFTFDVGGHVYTTSSDALNAIMSKSGGIHFPQRKAFYDYERMVPFPIQYNADQLGIDIYPNPQPPYESLGALLIAEFGGNFYRRVMGPFNRRVWSTSPFAMDADWISGRVALMKDKKEKWGTNASFTYAPGNNIISTLIHQAKMNGGKFWTNSDISFIDEVNKQVSFHNTHDVIKYENLYDTTGLMLERLEFSTMLPHNNVITIGIGLKRKIYLDFHWWYNSVNNTSPIHRITLLSRYHPSLAPEGCDSLLIEIPTSADETRGMKHINMKNLGAYGVIAMLEQAKFPTTFVERDVEEVTYIRSKGYPIPIKNHRNIVAEARRQALCKNIQLVGRWGAHGYYNLDHLILDAEAAINAANGIAVDDYLRANYYYKEEG
jgi:protoporphyrinogen oxidase